MSTGVDWRKVGIFVALTFALTWLLFLVIFLAGGMSMGAGLGLTLQAVMLMPGLAAIVLQRFVFRDSPLHRDNYNERPAWFFTVYIIYAVFYLLAVGAVLIVRTTAAFIAAALVTQVVTLAVIIFVMVLRGISGAAGMARAGLSLGRARYWLLFCLLLFALYALQTWLNSAFMLGDYVDIKALVLAQAGEAAEAYLALPEAQLVGLLALQSVIFGSFFGLPLAFGEEYGWRGFLQGELTKLGRVQGVALVGVIWGLWHAPVILMGYNYPGHPFLGVLFMTLYTVGLAFIFAHAVFRANGIWVAAFLHAFNNQVSSFLFTAVYTPADTAFSFGIGLPGLVIMAVVVVLLLLDQRVWGECGQPAGVGVPDVGATPLEHLIGKDATS